MSTEAPMTRFTGEAALGIARQMVLMLMPYFYSAVLGLVPRPAPGLGTVMCTESGFLLYDPETMRSWTPKQAAAVLIHEYMHTFLRHADRARKLLALGMLQDTPQERRLWNEMCDAEINDDLIDGGLLLPDGPNGEKPITPQSLGFPPHLSAEEYLTLYRQREDPPGDDSGDGSQAGGGGGGGGDGGGDGADDPPEDAQQPPGTNGGAGSGHCGSAAWHPAPNEPKPEDPDARSPVDAEVDRRDAGEKIAAHMKSKGQGSVPLGIRRAVEDLMHPAKVPWQQKLRTAVKNATAYRPGGIEFTRSRPSRRQGGLGPDAPILPAFRSPIANIAVVMDTSGSMGDQQLQALFAELQSILKAQAGASVTFVSCDAEVHGIGQVRTIKDAKQLVGGGGGTDFRPAFDALAKWKVRPDLIVFATDGLGTAPEKAPKSKTIWLLLDSQHRPCTWGEFIEVES